MAFHGIVSASDSYERLLEAVENGRYVPSAWLAAAKRVEEKARDREALEAEVEKAVEEATARREARVKAVEKALAADLPPLVEEYEKAREAASGEYEKAAEAVARARAVHAELVGMFNGMLKVTRGHWSGVELPRDPEGNVTTTAGHVPEVGSVVIRMGEELVTPPRPFRV